MFTRYQFAYHLSPQLYRDSDHILVGFHIEEAVYAPLYYGYGKAGEYGDRESMARGIEKEIIEQGPDTVIIHVKATADEIRRRMREAPHERGVIQEKDIEHILERFQYHYGHSLLRYRFELDTTTATVEETMEEFVEKIGPLISDRDRLRGCRRARYCIRSFFRRTDLNLGRRTRWYTHSIQRRLGAPACGSRDSA